MAWVYFTNNNPYVDNKYEEALNILLQQCLIDKEILYKYLSTHNCYRFLIKTNEDNNEIICGDGTIYLKNKFLSNKIFKTNLINYYKPLGIYVKGPKELVKRDGISTKRWIIDLTLIDGKNIT